MTGLLQLLEPGTTPLPHEEIDDSLAVGIDFGTTHSLVGISRDQTLEIFSDGMGHTLMPSVVSYGTDGTVTVGCEACQAHFAAPQDTLFSVKRFMEGDAQQGRKTFVLGDREVTPIEVSSEILKAARNRAERALSQKVTKAVITVPAYFDDTARTATRDAARLAGIEVLRLLNEPTAAALAYGLNKGSEGLYGVYDLGGGTFDVSLLRLEKGVFQVLATGGDTHLGGDDFDHCLLEACLQERQAAYPDESLSPADQARFILSVRRGKEALTTKTSTDVTLTFQGRTSQHTLTRKKLEDLVAPFVQRTLAHFQAVLDEANVSARDLKGLILVGGATRMPCISRALSEGFAIPLLKDLDPDLVVAQGAALQAEALTRGSQTLLLDVTPLSLGIETMGDLTEKIIPRNSPIPLSKAQDFTTYQDGQTALSLHVVQGEGELASQCRSLAKFDLGGIPPMVAGAARIRVTFTVDADGLLTVSAQEKTTGVTQHIEVKPTHGLSQEEVAALVRRSYEAGEWDIRERLLREAQVDAKRLILSVRSALKKDEDLLLPDEKEKIEAILAKSVECFETSNRETILATTKSLEKVTEDFAARRMEAHLKASLQGRALSDIESHVDPTHKTNEMETYVKS